MMFPKIVRSIASLVVYGYFVCALSNGSAVAQHVATVEGRAHAKGVVLLRALAMEAPCPRYITLRVGDSQLEDAEEQSKLTINGTYIRAGITENGECALLAPAFTGPTEYHEIGFAFSAPGTYHVQWQFGSTGVSPVDVAIDQTVRIQPSTVADMTFLTRVGDSGFLRHIFGRDPFESAPAEGRAWVLSPAGADYRSLLVIRELLKSTRAKEPGDVVRPRESVENAMRWAHALSEVARELPESSYAPYASYYAGVCYLGGIHSAIKDVRHETGIGKRDGNMTEQDWGTLLRAARDNPNYDKAYQALHLAAEKADAYLKPRALYMNAIFHIFGLAWDEAERALDEANAAAGGDPVIGEMVANLRRDLRLTRERYNQTPRATEKPGTRSEQEP